MGVIPSTGSAADCFDAMAESFFATLECELIDWSCFRTQVEARRAISQFLEGGYNTRRRYSALGYVSPNDFERATATSWTSPLAARLSLVSPSRARESRHHITPIREAGDPMRISFRKAPLPSPIPNRRSSITYQIAKALTCPRKRGSSTKSTSFSSQASDSPTSPARFIRRIITVSLETMKFVREGPKLELAA